MVAFDEIEISDAIEKKINGVHGVSGDDVLDAIEGLEKFAWHEDPERGRRLLLYGLIGRRRLCVILYPVDEEAGRWRLATAYPDSRP